ncbi:hypothetical protein BC830DRAFT_1119778 [Chytriomyces sp. MP71]|nr:hypothetical protein BC830DRAFT_1119778 [Chytriomyces sp. MP71]
MSSLFYAPDNTKWRVYSNDAVRQIVLTLAANLIILNIKPIVYIVSAGRLDWIVYYWIGSDYQTTMKHVWRQIRNRGNPLHLLVVIGILVTVFVSIAPSVLVLVAPEKTNTIGQPIGNAPIVQNRLPLLASSFPSPSRDMAQIFSNGILDASLTFKVNPETFKSTSAGLSLQQRQITNFTYSGVPVNFTWQGSSSGSVAILANVGNVGFGPQDSVFTGNDVKLALIADERVPAPQYTSYNTPSLRTIKLQAGSDLAVFTDTGIVYLQYNAGNVFSQEQVNDAVNHFDSSTSWRLWTEAIKTLNSNVFIAQNSKQITLVPSTSTTTNITTGACDMNTFWAKRTSFFSFVECTATALDFSGGNVSYTSIKWSPCDATSTLNTNALTCKPGSGLLWFTTYQYTIAALTPTDTTKKVLTDQIIAQAPTDTGRAQYRAAWFLVPGRLTKSRSMGTNNRAALDAYSLALTSMIAVDTSTRDNLVASGFVAINTYSQYDITLLLIILMCLIMSTVFVHIAQYLVYVRLKSNDIDYIVEYDLVVESLIGRDGFSTQNFRVGIKNQSDSAVRIDGEEEEMRALADGSAVTDVPRDYGTGGVELEAKPLSRVKSETEDVVPPSPVRAASLF